MIKRVRVLRMRVFEIGLFKASGGQGRTISNSPRELFPGILILVVFTDNPGAVGR